MQTNLVLRSVNGGAIAVENISGSIDANHTNGGITITNVSGSVLANTTNGKVTVSLNKVSPDKAMSFTSFNGRAVRGDYQVVQWQAVGVVQKPPDQGALAVVHRPRSGDAQQLARYARGRQRTFLT